MQDRRDAGKGRMQEKRNTGQEGCRKGGMKGLRDEGMKGRSDEEKEGFRSRKIQDWRDA